MEIFTEVWSAKLHVASTCQRWITYIELCRLRYVETFYCNLDVKAYCEGESDEGGGRKINRNCPISIWEAKHCFSHRFKNWRARSRVL